MKASELIKELQKAKKQFGNLPVNFDTYSSSKTVGKVVVYDEDGHGPNEKRGGEPFEIYLH